ncbi:MAG: 30S ribosomal protein S4 [Candidatus Aenigmatarchaeota archaeon]
MRRIRKIYQNPRMSWDSDEIADRKTLMRTYGLRRRREILIAQEILRNYRRRSRELIAKKDEKKMGALIGKLVKLGLLKEGQGLDDVLALSVKDLFERRLQTIVWRKGLATTAPQARQSITHGHVSIAGKKVKSPAYLVPVEEDEKITFSGPPRGGE